LRHLGLPLFLVALHDCLVINVKESVFLEPAQLESSDLGFISQLGDFGISTQHGDGLACCGFHAPVARRCNDKQQKQNNSKSEGETFCNRRLLQHTGIPFTFKISEREMPALKSSSDRLSSLPGYVRRRPYAAGR